MCKREDEKFSGVYDRNLEKLFVEDTIELFGIEGNVVFECGAYGIFVYDGIDWDLLCSKIKEQTGFDNTPCFCYNDNFVSFYELLWNYNCEDNICDVVVLKS